MQLTIDHNSMRTLRTIIVDDEHLARRLLRETLDKLRNVEVIGECKNGREAVEMVINLEPDLMFLDIQMPGMNGFDVVKALQSDIMPMVVFATAYEQFALDAFDIHAVDYILKSLDEDRVVRAVERAWERRYTQELSQDNKPPLMGAIDQIVKKVGSQVDLRSHHAARSGPGVIENSSVTCVRKLAIKDSDIVTLVPEVDIDWVDAAGDYMCIHVKGETHIMRCTMKELLSQLDDTLFKRVHRSTIANLDRIAKVTPHTKGEYFLHLNCGEKLKVSRNYKESIKAFISSSQNKILMAKASHK